MIHNCECHAGEVNKETPSALQDDSTSNENVEIESSWQHLLQSYYEQQLCLYHEQQGAEATLRGEFLAAILLQQQLHMALHRALSGCEEAGTQLLCYERAQHARQVELQAARSQLDNSRSQVHSLKLKRDDLTGQLEKLRHGIQMQRLDKNPDKVTGASSEVASVSAILQDELDSVETLFQKCCFFASDQEKRVAALEVSNGYGIVEVY
jgi:hypothetical protein